MISCSFMLVVFIYWTFSFCHRRALIRCTDVVEMSASLCLGLSLLICTIIIVRRRHGWCLVSKFIAQYHSVIIGWILFCIRTYQFLLLFFLYRYVFSCDLLKLFNQAAAAITFLEAGHRL